MLVGNDNRVLGTYDEQLISCPDRVIAFGGDITKVGPYKIHTFRTNGQFIVKGKGKAEVLVVGGGGTTVGYEAGGGGGGEVKNFVTTFYSGVYDISIGAFGVMDINGHSIDAESSFITRRGNYPYWENIEARGGQNGTPNNGGNSGNEHLGGVHIPYMKVMNITNNIDPPAEYMNIDLLGGAYPGGAGAGGGRYNSETKWHPINGYMEKYEYISGDPLHWPRIDTIVHAGDGGPGILSSISGELKSYGMGGRGWGGSVIQMGDNSRIQWTGGKYNGVPWEVNSGRGADSPIDVWGLSHGLGADFGIVIIRYYWNDLDLWQNIEIP